MALRFWTRTRVTTTLQRHGYNFAYLLALASLLIVTWLAYAPGLHGGFLFDDFANLPTLGNTGPIDHWATFWRYITSGTADPIGRPLTLLTFLLDARDWPASPYPFKLTNLILHSCNGCLLYALLTRLGALLQDEIQRARIAALSGTALWLLHPLLVSTTLYIVQREAMLPATCIISGLLLWLHGRQRLIEGKQNIGMIWSSIGLIGFTLLGVLAKANGALLPMYALVIEIVLLSPRHPIPTPASKRAYRAIMTLFGVLPAAIILGYVLWIGVNGLLIGGHAGIRPWSIGQRLLTEPRVILEYLKLLWLPKPFSSGLFNDQYLASTSLLRPFTTLPAMLAVFILIGGAWWQRRRHPALALAVLFYFVGQLLESTSIPLELYFEHRNYVPALLMFWPLGLYLADTHRLRPFKTILMIVLPLVLAGMTRARAEVWGNVQTQALVWAEINPNSPRAQANAAEIEMSYGHAQDAASRLETLLAKQPQQAQLAFNLIGAHCMMGGLQIGDMQAALIAMRSTANAGALFTHWYERMLSIVTSDQCPGLSAHDLLDLVDAGLQNPNLTAAGPQQDLTYIRGRIVLAEHLPNIALADFIHALDLQVRPGIALAASATLGAAGYPMQGLRMLDYYQQVRDKTMRPAIGMPMLHAWVLARQHYWPRELARLRRQLSLDVKASNLNTGHPDTGQDKPH